MDLPLFAMAGSVVGIAGAGATMMMSFIKGGGGEPSEADAALADLQDATGSAGVSSADGRGVEVGDAFSGPGEPEDPDNPAGPEQGGPGGADEQGAPGAQGAAGGVRAPPFPKYIKKPIAFPSFTFIKTMKLPEAASPSHSADPATASADPAAEAPAEAAGPAAAAAKPDHPDHPAAEAPAVLAVAAAASPAAAAAGPAAVRLNTGGGTAGGRASRRVRKAATANQAKRLKAHHRMRSLSSIAHAIHRRRAKAVAAAAG